MRAIIAHKTHLASPDLHRFGRWTALVAKCYNETSGKLGLIPGENGKNLIL